MIGHRGIHDPSCRTYTTSTWAGVTTAANTHVPAHRRDQLERLIRYTARGAVSLQRLTLDANGDLISTFTRPWSDGTTGIKLSALAPAPRVHPVRDAGCWAAHRKLRGASPPTRRQQGIETQARPVASRWAWARLLKRVFSLDLEGCPRCPSGRLRIIAAITCRPVIRRMLCRLKRAADPPPLAPARLEQGRFAWTSV